MLLNLTLNKITSQQAGVANKKHARYQPPTALDTKVSKTLQTGNVICRALKVLPP
jgi:hypothetical protein